MTEEQLLRMLDRMEPPMQTAGRLFRGIEAYKVDSFEVIDASVIKALRTKGYVVVDNFISPSVIQRVHLELIGDVADGKFLPAHRYGYVRYSMHVYIHSYIRILISGWQRRG